MKLAAGDSRYATASATSSARPIRPTGCSRVSSASIHSACEGSWAARNSVWRSVAIDPSATALARMPCRPYSTASARVSPSTAAFAVAYGRAPGHRPAGLV